ncbi:MAG: heavy metal-associated domain-containing protein [Leptolyngbyaceae bacterium]|nr:heavy metal-associated domain-containing protein [Leptolyngbyaceae bacterium]
MLTDVSPPLLNSVHTTAVPMKKLWLQLSERDNAHRYLECLQQSLYACLGVVNCEVNIRTRQVILHFDPFTANLAHVRKIIEDAGFVAEPIIH